VAVGVLRSSGQVLITRRPAGVHLQGYWEFPGGKVEPGEGRWAALERELYEEIGVRALDGYPLIHLSHAYPDRHVSLDVWEVTEWRGEPRGCEGQAVEWVGTDELEQRRLPPADRPILSALKLPRFYLVTPEPDVDDASGFLERLDAVLGRWVPRGLELVQLRIKAPLARPGERERALRLCELAAALAHRDGARIVLNAPERLAAAGGLEGMDGVHLSSTALRSCPTRPAMPLVGASCHDAAELRAAASLELDFAVLGPVRSTSSHPHADSIGWSGFAGLVERASFPVFALGGLAADDLRAAREHGGQGVAGISSFWQG